MAPMNSNKQMSVSTSGCQPKNQMVLPVSDGACAKTVSKSIAPTSANKAKDTERESEITDPVDHEGLDRRRVGFRLVIPEADQQIARETHALPAEIHLHQIVGGHQHQH